MQQKIKVAVVDDHPIFVNGLISLLEEFEEFEIFGGANSGKEFIASLKNGIPDVVLLDLEMSEMNGTETTEYLKKHYPNIKILILTMHDDEGFVFDLISKGAHGFIVKETNIDTIAEAICSVIETGYYFNKLVTVKMIKNLLNGKIISPNYKNIVLSEREKEITGLLCNEYTNREIADKLCINIRTIETHRENIMEKIGAKNFAGIIVYGIKYKLHVNKE